MATISMTKNVSISFFLLFSLFIGCSPLTKAQEIPGSTVNKFKYPYLERHAEPDSVKQSVDSNYSNIQKIVLKESELKENELKQQASRLIAYNYELATNINTSNESVSIQTPFEITHSNEQLVYRSINHIELSLFNSAMANVNDNNTYLYNLGDGDGTIEDVHGNDRIVFGAGITPDNITLIATTDALTITLSDGGTISIKNWYTGNQSRIEQFEFADGTVWGKTEILSTLLVLGGSGDDSFIHTYSYTAMQYQTGAGNDTIRSSSLDDSIDTGAGDDLIYSNSGNDTIDAGTGNDTIYTGSGNDTIAGGSGDDVIDAQNGDDTIEGGQGQDTLKGGYGNDTYIYNLGNGNDTIDDIAGSDRLVFGAGITPENITLVATTEALTITLSDGGTITFENWYTGNQSRIEQFEFADGTVWGKTEILSTLLVKGGSGDDSFIHTYSYTAMQYQTGAGNDTIRSSSLDDSIDTGAGDDLIYSNSGNDTIDAGSGDDTIYSGSGNDTIAGGSGDDVIDAQNGDDTIEGGQGQDTLIGGYGNDTYLYNLGDGNDTIDDIAGSDRLVFGAGITPENITLVATTEALTITLSDGGTITFENWYTGNQSRIEQFEFADGTVWGKTEILSTLLVLGGSGNDSFIHTYSYTAVHYQTGAGNDTIRSSSLDDTIDAGAGDDLIYSNSGNDTINAGAGNDTIYAGSGNDTITGGGGDDVIDAQNGDDTIEGGQGQDTLKGGYGNDTYIYNLGDGNDIIDDISGNDRLVFGAGITPENITLVATTEALTITLSDGGTITFENWYTGNQSRIEQFEFADGAVWGKTEILSTLLVKGGSGDDSFIHTYSYTAMHYQTGAGNDTIRSSNRDDSIDTGAGDDLIYSNSGNDTIDAGSGNDTIYSGSGNDTITGGGGDDVIDAQNGDDTIEGGQGQDTLIGGYGNDTYIYNLGDGNDTIDDTAGNDRIFFGAGITPDNILISENGTDLLVTLSDNSVITILNWYAKNYHIETFEFSTGQVLDKNTILDKVGVINNVPAPSFNVQKPVVGSYVSGNSFIVEGEISSQALIATFTINNEPVYLTSLGNELYRFNYPVEFIDASIDLELSATNVNGKNTVEIMSYYRDALAPVINVNNNLAVSPTVNTIKESPYYLSGSVTDENVSALTLNGNTVELMPGANNDEYEFTVAVVIEEQVETQLTLTAYDLSGNLVTKDYIVIADSKASIDIIAPTGKTNFISDGDNFTLQIIARLHSLQSSDKVRLSINQSTPIFVETNNSLLNTSMVINGASGEYTLTIDVLNASQEVITTSNRVFSLKNPKDITLALTKTVPANGQQGVEPHQGIEIYVNKTVDPALLSFDVRETVMGKTYINNDAPGTDFLAAEGFQLTDIVRNNELVPGGVGLIPGNNVFTFYPQRDLAYGANIFVSIIYDGKELSRFNYRVRELPTFLTGIVFDQLSQPISGIKVELPELGRVTTTDNEGVFNFGAGDSASNTLSGGSYQLVINDNFNNPIFGVTERNVIIEQGRHKQISKIIVPMINKELAFSLLESGKNHVLARGELKLDLTHAKLTFPDNSSSGLAQVSFVNISEADVTPSESAFPMSLYAFQPAGIKVVGEVSLSIKMLKIYNSYHYIPQSGSYVVLVGRKGPSNGIQPIGVGQIDGYNIHSVGALDISKLDYIGYALIEESKQEALQQYANGQLSIQALIGSL